MSDFKSIPVLTIILILIFTPKTKKQKKWSPYQPKLVLQSHSLIEIVVQMSNIQFHL